MHQNPADPTKRLNPYDLSTIAAIRNAHSKSKPHPIVSIQPYELKRFLSAYDLSMMPSESRSQ